MCVEIALLVVRFKTAVWLSFPGEDVSMKMVKKEDKKQRSRDKRLMNKIRRRKGTRWCVFPFLALGCRDDLKRQWVARHFLYEHIAYNVVTDVCCSEGTCPGKNSNGNVKESLGRERRSPSLHLFLSQRSRTPLAYVTYGCALFLSVLLENRARWDCVGRCFSAETLEPNLFRVCLPGWKVQPHAGFDILKHAVRGNFGWKKQINWCFIIYWTPN